MQLNSVGHVIIPLILVCTSFETNVVYSCLLLAQHIAIIFGNSMFKHIYTDGLFKTNNYSMLE